MRTEPVAHRSRRLWKGALLVLVLLPLVPEILILAASAYAAASGCEVQSTVACAVGPPSVTNVIRGSLQVAAVIGKEFADDNVVLVWLALCYVLIVLGWTRLSSRLLLALGTSLILAILPYFGPILAIGPLANPKCNPNEGGIPPECMIYGGNVGEPAHEAVRLGWKFFYGAPVAIAAFVVFALAVTAMHFAAKRRQSSAAAQDRSI
ncbi:hypothetical protein [Bradyrhizobium sp. NP1]|uniref:hypothetical protein n=1 Tax=Bradyrhizobium sp. NP1 TaxID=3049772 RepID=UPI0025A658B8|nr:hypothetical protein [Bradyrhizobium sp. NP1]WJR78933.1 hypothetical protein QOU61_03775 [Bradyrhizobium sp. NP1]